MRHSCISHTKRLVAVCAALTLAAAVARDASAAEIGGIVKAGLWERIQERRAKRDAAPSSAGSTARHITIDGVARDYIIHVPQRVAGVKRPVPTVFVLHGAKGSAQKAQELLGFDDVANREGFVTVYPQGLSNTWNDGRDQGSRGANSASTADDVAFLMALASGLVRDGIADARRLYIAGQSNGGFMALTMACTGNSPFAAFVEVIASTPLGSEQSCRWQMPLPVLLINGSEDPLVRFDGSTGRFGLGGNFAPPALAAYFAKLNDCTSHNDRALADLDPRDQSTVIQTVWTGCKAGSAVELYTIKGGGHQAPAIRQGHDRWLVEKFLGPRNHDIDTAETAWGFFQRFSR